VSKVPSWSASLTVLVDRGYYKGLELLKCEDAGVETIVLKPLSSNSKADGRFDKRDSVYDRKVLSARTVQCV
jgi:hypothetical protein